MKNLIQLDWYESLISELEGIKTETIFNARDMVIRGKWLIGEQIVKHKENFNRAEIYGKEIIRHIGESIQMSSTELYNCIQFYEWTIENKFSGIEAFLEKQNKNISWNKIVHFLLPGKKEEKQDFGICPTCGSKVNQSRLES